MEVKFSLTHHGNLFYKLRVKKIESLTQKRILSLKDLYLMLESRLQTKRMGLKQNFHPYVLCIPILHNKTSSGVDYNYFITFPRMYAPWYNNMRLPEHSYLIQQLNHRKNI